MVEEEEKGNRRVEGWEVGEGKKGKKRKLCGDRDQRWPVLVERVGWVTFTLAVFDGARNLGDFSLAGRLTKAHAGVGRHAGTGAEEVSQASLFDGWNR
jgi:hypothetical protein